MPSISIDLSADVKVLGQGGLDVPDGTKIYAKLDGVEVTTMPANVVAGMVTPNPSLEIFSSSGADGELTFHIGSYLAEPARDSDSNVSDANVIRRAITGLDWNQTLNMAYPEMYGVLVLQPPVGTDLTEITNVQDSEIVGVSLGAINPNDIVIIQFNDSVDISSFDFTRVNTQMARSLSIRYVYRDANTGVQVMSNELPGQLDHQDYMTSLPGIVTPAEMEWALKTSPITDAMIAGQYTWTTTLKQNDTLMIAPPAPTGVWLKGMQLRFEFDNSLKDDAGNPLISNVDHVVFARIVGDAEMYFDSPIASPTYWPYVNNSPANFRVTVGGYVRETTATDLVKEVTIKLTATNGMELLVIIPVPQDGSIFNNAIGDHQAYFAPDTDPASPNYRGGLFEVTFQLPTNPSTNQLYRWIASGEVLSSDNEVSPAVNNKIIYHECFENRPQLVDVKVGGKPVVSDFVSFRMADIGPKSVSFRAIGDFADYEGIFITNTYVSPNQVMVQAANISYYSSPMAVEKQEQAIITGAYPFTIGSDPAVDDAIYELSIFMVAKSGTVLSKSITVDIDTLGLEIANMRSQPLV